MNLTTLFVYYKLPQSHHAQTILLVNQFKEDLQAYDPQITVELLQRPEVSADGFETWMEVYSHPDGISSSMMARIQELAIQNGLPPQRKNEIFIPLE